MSSSPLYSRPGISGILLLVFLTGIIIGAHSFVQGYYLEDSKKSQHARLSVFKTSLVAELKRFDYLPEVIAQNPSITYSLEESPDQTSSMLLDLQQTAGVEAIYVLSRDGLTLASSNYQDSGSFVGKNYGFRPYFREALSQGYGRFYGIGATTRRPGYFVAAPIPEKNSAKAVVAVKFELGSLENSWASEEEHVFVSDKNGVINLSSTEEWRYKTLYPLTPGQLDELREQKQFADEPLPVLDHQSEDAGIGLVMINGEKFLESIVEIDVAGWRLHSLLPYQQVRQQLISFWTRVLAAGLILIAALLAVRIVRTRVALQQSLGESLKLRQLNQSLEQEIEERKRAESALLQAQKDLKLNSKLAAMGQLAASITHELNQPLAAMRTYTVSLKESLDTSLSS
ncbi:MAG: cache domain-containing protein [Pseudomonadota bacterium]